MASSKNVSRDLNAIANLLPSEQTAIDQSIATSPPVAELDPLRNFNDDFDSQLLAKKAAVQEAKKSSIKNILNEERILREERENPIGPVDTDAMDRAYRQVDQYFRMGSSSPVVKQLHGGRVKQHEDGSWTVTLQDGRVLSNLNEYDARTSSAYLDADITGMKEDAPEGFIARKATGIARSVVDIGLQGSLAFLRSTTLSETVDSWNRGMLEGQKDPITAKEIKAYQAGKLPKDHRHYKALTKLDVMAKESKASYDKFTKVAKNIKEKLPYNMRDQALAREAYQVVAEHEGNWAAMAHTAGNYTSALLSQGIDSVPWMVAFTIGGPYAQTAILVALAKGKGRQAVEEFKTKYKREPTIEEGHRIKLWSAIGTVAEKFGDLAALKLLGGKLSWIKGIQSKVAKSTPLTVASLLTLKIPGALIGEGVSGASTAVSEQIALEGEVTDTAAIGYDALAEAFGTPGGVASMYAGQAAYNAAKMPFKPSKIDQQLDTIEENLANAESKTYGSVQANRDTLEQMNAELEEALKPDVKAKVIEEENERILAESEGKTDPKSRFNQKHSKSQAEAAYDKAVKDHKENIAKFEKKLESPLTEEDVKIYKESQEKQKANLLNQKEQKTALKTEEGREARIKEIDEEINQILDEEGFPNQAKLRGLTEEKEKLLRKSQPLTTRVKQVFKDTSPKEAVEDREYIPIEDDEFAKIVDSIDTKKLSDPTANPDDIIAAINEIADIQKKREVTASQEDVLERIKDELSGYAPEQKETLNSIKGITNANDETLERLQRIAKT